MAVLLLRRQAASPRRGIAPQASLSDLRRAYSGLVAAPKPSSGHGTRGGSGGSSSTTAPSQQQKLQNQQKQKQQQKHADKLQERKEKTVSNQKAQPLEQQQQQQRPRKQPIKRHPQPSAGAMQGNGRGFGAINTSNTASGSNTKNDAAGQLQPGAPLGRTVRVWRHAVPAELLQAAVDECGWRGRVVEAGSISDADLLLAMSATPSGRRIDLAQAERAASNAGKPFVCVGRKMSGLTLRPLLAPYVLADDPQQHAESARRAEAEDAARTHADAWFAAAGRWRQAAAQRAAGASSSDSGRDGETAPQHIG